MRLYIGSPSPSENLIILANYVGRVYAPMWFRTKSNPGCTNGSKNLMFLIKITRYLPEELLKIIDPVIQRNRYYGHPENILIAMMEDERDSIRQLAVERIMQARNEKLSSIRPFKIPKFNFQSEDYTELIDWDNCIITDPPLLKEITQNDLQSMCTDLSLVKNTLNIPCHSQAVERCVKVK